MDFMTKFGSLLIFCLGLLRLQARGQSMALTLTPAETNVKKFVNDSYFVSCVSPDGSYTAEWINPKGNRVDSSPHSRIRTENLNGVDLFLTRITTQDGGNYTCKSPRARSSTSFQLTVIRPITFDTSYAEQWAEEGREHLLRCKVSGHSAPSIHWRVDTRSVPTQSSKYKIMKDGLMIHNVTQADASRTYICFAMDMSSPLPVPKQMSIRLKVKMKPRFVGNSKVEHWGVLNEWANLTCAVTAEPRPRFEWSHRGKPLTPSDTVVIHNEENVSILQVLVRLESMFGAYDCKVRNEMGDATRHLFLSKGRKPAAPKLELIVAGSDAAKIRVIVPNPTRAHAEQDEKRLGKNLPITGIIIQYKMQTKADWSPANFTVHDNYQAFILQGLTPSINYNVRAALKNQAAQGDFSSSTFNFKTVQNSRYPISATTSNHHRHLMISSFVGVILNFVFLNVVIRL